MHVGERCLRVRTERVKTKTKTKINSHERNTKQKDLSTDRQSGPQCGCDEAEGRHV